MKLIIDIPEEDWELIKEADVCRWSNCSIFDGVINGTPLEEIQNPCIECSQNCCVRELNGEKCECQKVYVAKENK